MKQAIPSTTLPQVDSQGWQTSQTKLRSDRSAAGQFFTPGPIATHLAGWFRKSSLDQPSIHILDPGAGAGALTAAVVDRVVACRTSDELPNLQEITLEVWETDSDFLPTLHENLGLCAAALADVGVQTTPQIHSECFISAMAEMRDSDLFSSREGSTVTHAILNPPYRKITTTSTERAHLRSIGIETSNLYSAFVWLALRQLKEEGELAAITPRSFCNGPYFKNFRRALLADTTWHHLHLFDSRAEAFGRDEVLQENILYHLSRNSAHSGTSKIVVSTGSLDTPTSRTIPTSQLVSISDPDRIIHIATAPDAQTIRTFVEKLPCKLEQLDVQVSTGPVVDFRLKDSLLTAQESASVPLLYPHCIKGGNVEMPPPHSSDQTGKRLANKPVAILDSPETRKWLLNSSVFVLVKRFSSKEEKRRIVAGVLDPDDSSKERLGIENHINFFHRNRSDIPPHLARGLTRFLNSTVIDRYFRQFNGHTQVNASDLRNLRYPTSYALEALGKAALDDSNQRSIDAAMQKILSAPSLTQR